MLPIGNVAFFLCFTSHYIVLTPSFSSSNQSLSLQRHLFLGPFYFLLPRSSFHPPSLSRSLSPRWPSWLLWALCWSVCDVFVHRARCWSTRCVSTPYRWPVAWPIWSRGGSSTGTWQPGREGADHFLFKVDLISFSSYKKGQTLFKEGVFFTFSMKSIFLSGIFFTAMLNYLYCFSFSSTQKFTGHYSETWPSSKNESLLGRLYWVV